MVNRLLRSQSWAAGRLHPFAGKRVRVVVPPFQALVDILAGGQLSLADEGEADAVVRLSAPALFRLLAGDEAAARETEIDGDPALAAAIGFLAGNLRWDAEEDLSRVVGDILAHRLVRGGRGLLQWQRDAFWGGLEALTEYWTEERPLLAKGDGVRRFVHQVDEVRDQAERLEKRLEALSRRLGAARGAH